MVRLIELTTDVGRLDLGGLQMGMGFGPFHHRALMDVDVHRNTERPGAYAERF